MHPMVQQAAYHLRMAIETKSPAIPDQTQQLVHALGGSANVSELTPGAASVYLLSLMLSQPTG